MKVLLTVAQLRNRLYQDGFTCDGIVFRRFKRSSGSSRIGKCLFIDEQLYPRMHKWELCGLKVKEGQEIDLAALEAYIALTLSSIVGTIPLRPENFLVIDDYKSVFKDRVVATRIGSDNWLTSKPEEVEIENSIWDGQSLIDKSAMGEWQDYGMILLRNRFSNRPALIPISRSFSPIVALLMCPSFPVSRWRRISAISRLLLRPVVLST